MVDILEAHDGVKFPLSEVLKRRAYTLLVAQPYEAVVTYEALAEAIGLDPRTDDRARSAVLRAGRALLHDDRKKIVNVREIGYRIVKPSEQADVALNEQRRARRWYARALNTATYVALENLSPADVARIMTEQARIGLLLGMARRLGKVKTLPDRAQMVLPSKDRLVDLFRRKTKTPA